MLDLTLDRSEVAPGEEVTGVVEVRSSGACRALNVALRFVEQSVARRSIGREVVTELARGDLVAGDRYPFALTMPADALPWTATDYLVLLWEVQAWADLPLAVDPSASEPIHVILPDRPAARG